MKLIAAVFFTCALILFTLFFIQIPIVGALLLFLLLFSVVFWVFPKQTLLGFFLFMLFQGTLAQLTRLGVVFNLDELGIIAMVGLVLIRKIVLQKNFFRSPIDIPLFILVIIGSLSSIMHNIVPWPVAAGGLFLFLKGFFLYYIVANVELQLEDVEMFKKWLYGLGLLTLIHGVLGVFWPRIFLIPIGVSPSGRFGLPSLQSYLGHSGGFSALMGILFCSALIDNVTKKQWRYGFLAVLFFTGIIFALRRTTLVGVILAFLTIYSIRSVRHIIQTRIATRTFILLVTVCVVFSGIIILSFEALRESYLEQESPRSRLLKAGAEIAMDYFPLGSGFGTYSGGINQKFYSPLFYKYRLSHIWGLSEYNSQFINDTFWPHIYAETGIFGFICYLWIMIAFIRICLRGTRHLRDPRHAAFAVLTLMLFILSLIESTKATFYEMSLWAFFYFGSIGAVESWLHEKQLLRHTSREPTREISSVLL